ncbi:hypothetical protein PTKIN_Ptkin11bG0093800 [Pterospermum kingtungense]
MGYSAEIGINMTEQDTESFSYAMQLVNSIALFMCLHTVIQLEVFEIITKPGPDAKLFPQEITAELQTQNLDAPMMLGSILRLLATYSVLGCSLVVDHEMDDVKK